MKFPSALRLLLTVAVVLVIDKHSFGQRAGEDVVLTWNKVAVRTASSNSAGSLVMVRALALMHTAMFDAWAQYAALAV